MARKLYQPHDHLFRKVFSEATEAAGLLRPQGAVGSNRSEPS